MTGAGPTVGVIVTAAGSGQRLGGGTPKALRPIGGVPIVRRAVTRFISRSDITEVVVVGPAEDLAATADALAGLPVALVPGGEERQHSIAAGLAGLASAPEFVLTHDAARPFVPDAVIDRVLAALREGADAAIPGLPLADTVKEVVPGGPAEPIVATPDRGRLRAVQTPQGFRRKVLLAAHAAASSVMTDDAALVEAAGGRVVVVPGDPAAFKITYPWDLRVAESLARAEDGES